MKFWAACCTAFFGFLRVSEFTCSGPFIVSRHLSCSDLVFDPAGYYRLFLKTPKTHPFHHGCVLVLGPSGQSICPVAAIIRYLQMRGSSPGPLFFVRMERLYLRPPSTTGFVRFCLRPGLRVTILVIVSVLALPLPLLWRVCLIT